MISATDMKFLMCATCEAEKSPVLMRHGAVAVANGKVLGKGYNHYRSTSMDGFIVNTMMDASTMNLSCSFRN